MSSLSEATIKFTLDLFQKLRKSEDNVFYSPVSIAAALAMVYLGAKGGTAEEIEKVLHFNEITAKSTEKPKTDHEYVDGVKKFYLADVESVDFVNAAEESQKKINTWVEKQTHEKIKDIFPNGSLQSDTKLVLVNAVYFRGQWDLKFHEEDIIEEKFGLNKLDDELAAEKLTEWTKYRVPHRADKQWEETGTRHLHRELVLVKTPSMGAFLYKQRHSGDSPLDMDICRAPELLVLGPRCHSLMSPQVCSDGEAPGTIQRYHDPCPSVEYRGPQNEYSSAADIFPLAQTVAAPGESKNPFVHSPTWQTNIKLCTSDPKQQQHQEPSGTLPKQDLQNLPVATLIRFSRAPVRNSHIVLPGKIPMMENCCSSCYVHRNGTEEARGELYIQYLTTENTEAPRLPLTSAFPKNTGVPGHCKVTMSTLSEATIKFTLDLFQKLRKSEDNVFYSPVSIAGALAMVYLGAKGGTAEEIEKVLHLNEITAKSTEKPKTDHAGNSRSVHHQFQKLLTELNKPTETYELKSANKVYKEKSFQFLQEYVDDVKKFYLADVESVDFVNAAEESQKKINTWVEKQTHEKIKEIFPNGSLQSDTTLVLVNAVYFKGQWDMKFHEEDTVEEKFWLNKDRSKSVKMMKQTNYLKFAHLEDVQAKILEIPYKGKALSMFVLLPDEVDGLQKLEDNLTGEKLMEWTSLQNMAKLKVHLHLPRFKVEESYDLNTVLTDMGMVKAFSAKDADFSGMSRNGGLVVSQVKHKSFVEVNEEGTEAAAATGVEMGFTSSPVYEDFHCDHPFLFFIKQNENNSILFFGRVSSP
ncbi:uncharacterized protein O8D03_008265 [Erethizon dorsatum]